MTGSPTLSAETITLSQSNLESLSTSEEIQECEYIMDQFLQSSAQYGEDAATALDKRAEVQADPVLQEEFNDVFGKGDLGVAKYSKTPLEELKVLLGEYIITCILLTALCSHMQSSGCYALLLCILLSNCSGQSSHLSMSLPPPLSL